MWCKLSPNGDDTLGLDELMKMAEMMYPMIDKINAPHTDAHWIWDIPTMKPVYDFHVKIYGMAGRYTFP